MGSDELIKNLTRPAHDSTHKVVICGPAGKRVPLSGKGGVSLGGRGEAVKRETKRKKKKAGTQRIKKRR